MKKIFYFLAVVLFILRSDCFPQSGIESSAAMIEMMYLFPYNYNSADSLLKSNHVKTVTMDYAGLKIVINVNRDGLMEHADVDSIAWVRYKYYDDRRMSDLELGIKGFENVRSRMLFAYGSRKSDFEAIFLFSANAGVEQKAAFFCDNNGRVLRMSLAVQKTETVKCEFSYSSDRIEKILFRETGPEYFDKLTFTTEYKYRPDGLIDYENLSLPGDKNYKVAYTYTFYE